MSGGSRFHRRPASMKNNIAKRYVFVQASGLIKLYFLGGTELSNFLDSHSRGYEGITSGI
jgi:hypothetical protein